MNDEQILDAIEQVKAHCREMMDDYQPLSMRGALYTLGFDEQQADDVIRFCALKGFDYCIDPLIPVKWSETSGLTRSERPMFDVCFWGPDQLRSRLCALRR